MPPSTPSTRSPTRLATRVVIGTFLAALCIPTLGMVLGIGTSKAPWFEASAPFPTRPQSAMELMQLPNKLRHYVNAHFAFRVPLMALYAQLKVRVFGVSGSDAVMLGQDGWLFFTGDRIVDDYRCSQPFTEQELAQWRDRTVRRRDWLRSRGIPYVFFLAPNTGTIYPEYLPAALHRFGPTSRLEQLTSYLQQHSDVRPIDLRAPLKEAKASARLYYRTDSHWNQMGGFVAYQQIAARLREVLPAWKTRSLADFDQVPTPNWAGDLSYMLGAPSLFRETRIDLVPHHGIDVRSGGVPISISESEGNWSIVPEIVREGDAGEIPRAVVLRDSYFGGPAQFLSSHFGRMVMLWTNDLDPKVIQREKPDVVIEEVVERSLMHPLVADSPLP
jgi:alginate O-acetyltransferase complex protein AlgJ